MSEMSTIAPVITAPMPDMPADAGGGDDGGFDRAAALAQATEMLGAGDDAPAEEAPAEATEPEVETEAKTEPQTDEEKLEARKNKLKDKDGKLSQDKLDAAFAKLTSEGKRLRGKQEAFKAERATFEEAKRNYDAAIEQAAARVNAQEKEFEELREQSKTTPLLALEKLGWSVQKLVKFIQNDGKHTPEELIESTKSEYETKLKTQEARLAELESSIKKRSFESAAGEYQAKAIKTMEGLMSQYEFINKYDLNTEVAPKVLQNIAHIYREGGELDGKKYPKGTALDPKTVLDYFEKKEAAALARFGIRPGQAGATNSVAKPGAAQPKALSNTDTSSRSVKPPSDDAEFDRDAALREVQQLLHG